MRIRALLTALFTGPSAGTPAGTSVGPAAGRSSASSARPLAAPAAVLLLAAAAGCTAGDGGAAQSVRAESSFGAKPTITFPGGEPPADLQVGEQMTGTGNVIKANDLVIAHYTAHVWDGEDNRLLASSFNQGAPASFPLNQSITGVSKALRGHRVGSRVVAAIPPGEGYGPNPPGGMGAGDALFYVIDVLGAFSPGAAATGTGGPGELAGVKITGGPGERPALTLPDDEPPAGLRTEVLVQGRGAKVQPGQLIVAQYEARVWGSESSAESTWAAGQPRAFTIGNGSVIKGWDRALTGVPVGSRVAMVVPPGLGYDKGLPPLIKPADTLVFVVDVLAAY
ncbi:FKBP-type peptidyl-prolyl cis-trans isomerase [Planomonospora venezuelensis]|uniref:peptidylprolyl isomerase n=1 Tax=Planomonospora venezuelensis TaxID=1999 RepID=A0A841DAI7_PLAVE|nr:FKBP-type peptidyl-prolyl cis-trans isomerase [Planomonospora venezuelensis]MBB5967642.1 peptidylprolyl isomerase [Planomonospora venezuelensis]GIN03551.1 peptidylprolyl isomerase [Planomonospora venezuelensis]